MIEILPQTGENVLFATAHGEVTAEDYERVLVPAIDAKLKTHKKIRLLFHLGKDFTGYTVGAMWDDAKLGIGHLTAFEKIAVVTDVHWISEAVKFFRFFVPCPVKVFRNERLTDAKDWLAGSAT